MSLINIPNDDLGPYLETLSTLHIVRDYEEDTFYHIRDNNGALLNVYIYPWAFTKILFNPSAKAFFDMSLEDRKNYSFSFCLN